VWPNTRFCPENDERIRKCPDRWNKSIPFEIGRKSGDFAVGHAAFSKLDVEGSTPFTRFSGKRSWGQWLGGGRFGDGN
jgi:hypothetical protein